MLRTYGPGCDGSIIDAEDAEHSRRGDLDRPRGADARRRAAGRAMHQAWTCRPRPRWPRSSRRAASTRERRALHDGKRASRRVEKRTRRPRRSASFLPDNRLVTIRYATPKPVRAFESHARRDPELVRDAPDGAGAAARRDHRPACRRDRGRQREHGSALRSRFSSERGGRAAHPRREADGAAHQHRPNANLAHEDPLLGGQHHPHAELPRRLQPHARGRRNGASPPCRRA